MDFLKNILEGGVFTPPIKHFVSKKNISFKIPAIFISNYVILDIIQGKDTSPLKERFQIVTIPEDAKIYKVDDENEYSLLFDAYNRSIETSQALENDIQAMV